MRGARIVDRVLLAPIDQHLALVRPVVAHDAFDERALAGAVLAQQRMEGAGRDLHRHVVERGELAEALGHADRFEPRAPGADGSAVMRSPATKSVGIGDGAEHAALHLDHLDGVVVVALVGRAAAVLQQQAFEAAVVGLAHGGVDADVGGDAGEHDVVDAAQAQHQLEIGGAERALAGLVDDRLLRQRRELRDDVPARLAAHQDAAARARIADAGADAARAPALVGGQVGEIGPMAFARVDDVEALGAHGREHALDRLDRRARQRQVVAHLVDIAADAAEIGLHVDDDQRRVLRPQIAVVGPGIGLGGDIASLASMALRYLVMVSSAGAPTSVRLGEQVMIMMTSVRM